MPDVVSSNVNNHPSENIISSFVETGNENEIDETSGLKPISTSTGTNPKELPLDGDTSTFTFQPQLNKNSRRLSQTLETDFMSRQQKHIEKQQKYVS